MDNSTSGGLAATRRNCIIYVKNGNEHWSPWFTDLERAQRALEALRRRYGAAVMLRD